jgi:two-component system, response regulator
MTEFKPVEILIVEDNPDDAEIVTRALSKNKLANSLHWAKDGEEALDFLFCRGQFECRNGLSLPRLILLDLRLPKVDGMEVLHVIKADPKLKLIPVVVMTSSTQDEDVVRSYDYGVNSFVSKPVDFKAFSDAIGTVGLYWMVVNRAPVI